MKVSILPSTHAFDNLPRGRLIQKSKMHGIHRDFVV